MNKKLEERLDKIEKIVFRTISLGLLASVPYSIYQAHTTGNKHYYLAAAAGIVLPAWSEFCMYFGKKRNSER